MNGAIFGIVMDGHPLQIGFDIHDPSLWRWVYRWQISDNESAYRKAVLADRQPHTIVSRSASDRCEELDGQDVVNWEGDSNRLTSPVPLSDDKNVSFGTGFNKFKFHKLELRPLSPV